MRVPFWEYMIREGLNPSKIRRRFDYEFPGKPIWCFVRRGATHTPIHNGYWTVSIGGEHEDSYDPDFMIYNDVVVRNHEGVIRVFGYPSEVFPPTDFHTASLIDDDAELQFDLPLSFPFVDSIVIIGGLGYPEQERTPMTPVFRLDLTTYAIERLETLGDSPGHIQRHTAAMTRGGSIRVMGGKRLVEDNLEWQPNEADYSLDLNTLIWTRLT